MPSHTLAENHYGSLCAEIYDLDKPAGALHDIGYYTTALRGLGGPVLEAGVGTGRLLIPLLEAGIEAVGFDASAEMLAVCRRNCESRGLAPDLRQARFQDFAFETAFAAIVVPVSSFIFVDDFHEALAVLRRFHDALAPGGRLMIDLPPLSYLTDDLDGARLWTAVNGDLLRYETRRTALDMVRQTRKSHGRYERWRDGRLLESELELMSMRIWGVEEFRLALLAAGFAEVSVNGGLRRDGVVRSSDRVINYVAVRAP